MYPLHIASTSSSDIGGGVSMLTEKTTTDLLTPTAIRVIQLVEIPAPPPQSPHRRLPPSSASSSSAPYSSDASSSEDDIEEDAQSYCSSMDLGEEEEEAARAREAEASKMKRILAWRAQFAAPLLSPPTFTSTPTFRTISRKRSNSSCSSTHRSKRSRTSASPAPSLRATHSPAPSQRSNYLGPPSPTNLARRHTSPRHHVSHSLTINATPFTSLAPDADADPFTLSVPYPTHHRAQSFSAHADTVCPACDRRFSSKRAFRVHATLGGGDSADGREGEGRAACGAAVAYALEACGGVP
ncbi:hypothetical protein C8R43DRAFT_528506 [Mycena crocata]|nr:hypothetical protein C8R43DRAFT_528506 [Mycena crocata]